jgi:phosphatidylserine/phosphatidylglycerophosphate/cardiolipin synthase-like enzyme
MGTFHSKYMVIDRRIACVSSNNIQDRVNLEMNIHLEGPIVDAFYDMALLSWAEKMDPPLPLLVNPSLVNRSARFRGAREQAEGHEEARGGSGNGTARDCFEEARLRKQEMIKNAADALPSHPGAYHLFLLFHSRI